MSTKLDAYLKRTGISDADFGVLIERDRSMVSKLRRGMLRPTLDVAAAIETSTAGEVPMQSWVDGAAGDSSGPMPPFATRSTAPTNGTRDHQTQVKDTPSGLPPTISNGLSPNSISSGKPSKHCASETKVNAPAREAA